MSRLMTDGEIRTSYNQAKDKKKQIGILADLNQCSKEEIQRIISGEPAENLDGFEPLPVKRRPAKLDAETQKKIAMEYLAGGIKRDAIAEKYGISLQTVTNYVARYKKSQSIKTHPPAQKPKGTPRALPSPPPSTGSGDQKSQKAPKTSAKITRAIDSLFDVVNALMAQTERECADFENIAIIKSEYSTNCIVEKDGIRIDVQKLNKKEKKQ